LQTPQELTNESPPLPDKTALVPNTSKEGDPDNLCLPTLLPDPLLLHPFKPLSNPFAEALKDPEFIKRQIDRVRRGTREKTGKQRNRGRRRARGVDGPRTEIVSQAEIQARQERRKEKVSKEFDDLVQKVKIGKCCRSKILGAAAKEAPTQPVGSCSLSLEPLPR
jgi:hypothetical protein